MRRSILVSWAHWVGLGGLMCGFLLALGTNAEGQQKPKDLLWTHAFDLACRRLGEAEFTKNTQKFGMEAFKDTNNGLGLYISQVGSLAAAHGFGGLKPPLSSKAAEWITGLDLPARKAGEEKFDNATVHSIEVYRDPNTNNWLYITEKGYVAAASAKGKNARGADKKPKWMHSVDLRVQKGGRRDWKDAAKFGIEVYRDNSTGNLVYICETGAIAVVPDKAGTRANAGGDAGEAPAWLHGLDLACRKHNEPKFSKDTRKFGVEVFLDKNNGNLIFLCESGSIAVTLAPKNVKIPTPSIKEPVWTHGLNLKVRKAGDQELGGAGTVYGAEAFRDDNVGVTLYICETGSITAVAKD